MPDRVRGTGDLASLMSALSPVAIATLGAVLVLLQLLAAGIERRSSESAPLERGSVIPVGFEIRPDGTNRSIASEGDLHSLAKVVQLHAFRDYEIGFDVLDPAPGNVLLMVDFFATGGYDDPDQERQHLVGVESIGSRVELRINAGHPPKDAFLRVFYFGPPGLELGEIHFREISILRSAFERIAPWLALGCFALAAWLVIAARTLPASSPQPAAPSAHAGWTLVAIYLAVALGHFALHLFAPFWRGDEVGYKGIASALWRLGPHVEIPRDWFEVPTDLPSMLYPYLISPAFAAGNRFYAVIRLINALVMSAAVFPTFWIGRKYLPRSAALFVALLAGSIPFMNLSAYAVTEVLFYPLFVAAAWLALESLLQPRSHVWPIALGCAAAVALNTRASGLVILPCFLLCGLWIALRERDAVPLLARGRWLLAPVAFVPAFFAVQWLTGVRSVASSGIYRPVVDQGGSLIERLLASPEGTLDLVLGHLATLAVPFALPIALVIWRGLVGSDRREIERRESAGRLESLHVVTAVFLAGLLALSLLFTVVVSGTDVGGLGRWHSRYYFHAYPLLLLSFATFLATPSVEGARKGPWVWVTVGALIVAHCWFVDGRAAAQSPWFGSIVDNMDVQWLVSWNALRWPLLAATLLLTRLWYRDSVWLRPASVALALVWIVVANLGTAGKMQIGEREAPDPCGKLASTFLELQPGKFAVIAGDPKFREAASFWNPYLPSFSIGTQLAPRYLAARVASDLDFIVTDGYVPEDPRYELRADGGGCRIYSARPF